MMSEYIFICIVKNKTIEIVAFAVISYHLLRETTIHKGNMSEEITRIILCT